jgi:hypothetical protein
VFVALPKMGEPIIEKTDKYVSQNIRDLIGQDDISTICKDEM